MASVNWDKAKTFLRDSTIKDGTHKPNNPKCNCAFCYYCKQWAQSEKKSEENRKRGRSPPIKERYRLFKFACYWHPLPENLLTYRLPSPTRQSRQLVNPVEIAQPIGKPRKIVNPVDLVRKKEDVEVLVKRGIGGRLETCRRIKQYLQEVGLIPPSRVHSRTRPAAPTRTTSAQRPADRIILNSLGIPVRAGPPNDPLNLANIKPVEVLDLPKPAFASEPENKKLKKEVVPAGIVNAAEVSKNKEKDNKKILKKLRKVKALIEDIDNLLE